MDECPFCEIAAGRDPRAEIVCEDARWVAFFPPEPATPGHTLVIPKAHVTDLWSLPLELAEPLMQAVIRVGRAVDQIAVPEGMNLISSSGTAAEQSVFHLHLHVVPRWARDGFGQIWPPGRPMGEAFKADLADRIRDACRSPGA